MKPPTFDFFLLNASQRREVHFTLCQGALAKWEEFARSHSPIEYTDSVVGMHHVVDVNLPREAFDAAQTGRDSEEVTLRYREPIVSMQDDDLVFPENIEFAYYAIYNLFCKYVLHKEFDDWIIVNQALSSEEDSSLCFDLLKDAVRKVHEQHWVMLPGRNVKSETPRFLLYRGDTLLGVVDHADDDFPWHHGSFEPARGFSSVKGLFDKARAILEKRIFYGAEWEAVWSEITLPGLSLVSVSDGRVIREPYIHIEGTETWWRC
jgi:hypothetical protein